MEGNRRKAEEYRRKSDVSISWEKIRRKLEESKKKIGSWKKIGRKLEENRRKWKKIGRKLEENCKKIERKLKEN